MVLVMLRAEFKKLSVEDLEDLVQDAALATQEALKNGEEVETVVGFAKVVARRRAFDLTKRRNRVEFTAFVDDQEPPPPQSADPVDQFEVQTCVRRAVGSIEGREREALVLVHLKGLKTREAARIMRVGVPRENFLLSKGRKKLKALLEDLA